MLYNKNQADTLFFKEAILIGSCDMVPMQRVAELLGDEAALFAERRKRGFNGFGIGDYTLCGLDIDGFRNAVSYVNVSAYREVHNEQSVDNRA